MSAPKKMKSHEKVLILGSGGREHALAWKMAQSDLVQEVYVAPGNAGTLDFGKVSNIDLDIRSFDDISDWCKSTKISLVIVGPEDPLAKGLADHLTSQGVPCFGPTAQAAQIEASKEFAKSFMVRHEIPTARYKSFTEVDEACEHIRTASYKALVVKASGLAAGKGVVVAESVEEACEAVKQILGSKKFGAAGETIVVEELLEGEEVSCLAFTDGTSIAIMPAAQDHKRLKEGDKGPNTGGMGAYCPYPKLTEEDLITIEYDILQKAVDGLREEDIHYVGVLYAGVMLTNEGPKVLEFNCRFGDPETQSILPLMESDLFVVTKACIEGTLAEHMPHFDKESKVLGIVVASGGYPNSYNTGYPITGIPQANATTLIVFHAGTTIRHHQLVTSGGRVLAVMAKEKDFETASEKAQKGAALIQFTDSYYRSDIGYRVLTSGISQQPLAEKWDHTANSLKNGLSYKQAGVDIVAGNSLVELIKPLAKATRRSGCDATLGSFGAIFNLQQTNFSRNALLVSGTDGVGTKLKIAHAIGFHKSVGIDLVAMVVNDILAHGAEPLFFLDYFACGRLDVPQARDVIEGVAQGCSQAGCALVGGETAEMAGMYRSGEYDLAGFGVGAVEKDQLLPFMNQMKDGDVVLGLPSSGIHSNGFSLVRKIIEINDFTYGMPSPVSSGKTLGEELLTPTKIYVKSLLPLMQQNLLKGFAHITGGGLVENIPRILPKHLAVELDATSWNIPAIFGWIQHNGKVPAREMIRTYNCGLGGIIIVSQMNVLPVIEALIKSDDKVCIVGKVITKEDSESVMIKNLETCLQNSYRSPFFPTKKKKNVAVLISGSGTNLQALIDHTECPGNKSSAQIVLVISNKPNVQGLERAQKAGIRTLVIDHKLYKTREDFDDAIHKELVNANIDLVCLAGFMRILSGSFVNKWNGRILNVHPSLLPSFKGANAHKLVLESGVRISGCTVHFVAEEIDSGAILVQKSAPVLTFDTEETLSERVKKLEHVAYPLALELVASEKAVLQDNGKIFWKE